MKSPPEPVRVADVVDWIVRRMDGGESYRPVVEKLIKSLIQKDN